MVDVPSFDAWVLPAGDGVFTWGSGWRLEERLVPRRYNLRSGNAGSAQFDVLKRYHRPTYAGTEGIHGGLIQPGQWVAITCDNEVLPFNWATVRWWGYITKYSTVPALDGDDRGQAVGAEIGALLDQVQLRGWAGASNVGPSIPINSPGTFNLNGPNGVVIGNRTTDASGKETLCRIASDCGVASANFFTRYRLLNYAIVWLWPTALPIPTLSLPTDVQAWMDDTTAPEVFDIESLSLKGLLDLLMPRSRGLGWRIDANGSGWVLSAYANTEGGESGVPAQSPTNPTLPDDGTVKSVDYEIDESAWYDEVEVRGSPIVICGSLAASDNGWVKGWNATQESAWKTGSSQTTLTPEAFKDACARVREAAHLRNVFVRYGIGGEVGSGILHRSTAPGATPAGTTYPFFPQITWDGSTVAAAPATSSSQDPLWTATTFERTLPWFIGVKGDGTDTRDADAKAQAVHLEPRVYIYDTARTPSWRDLLVDEKFYDVHSGGASVDVDDRGPWLYVRCSPPERLAGGDWSGIVRPRFGYEGSSAPLQAYDYRKMVATIAVASDQRLSVVKRRGSLTAAQVRRRLVLQDDKLQCWYVHDGTVVGIKADGTPDAVATGTFTRNDWPTAEKRARAAAAWALAQRYAATIVMARPDSPPYWAAIGVLLGTITTGSNSNDVLTAIESIDVDLGDTPSITIITDLPEMPSFASGPGGASSSPSAGGAVSMQLGGTVAQATAAIQTELVGVRQALSRIPVVASRPASVDRQAKVVQITQASPSFAVGDVVRPDTATWVKSLADVAAHAVVGGVVIAAQGNDYLIALPGSYIAGMTGLVKGSVYYLDGTTAGAWTTTAPTLAIPVLVADSTTTGVIIAGAGGGGGDAIIKAVTKTAHGFTVGQVLRVSGTSYALAKADTIANAQAIGVVSAVADVDHFTLTEAGWISGLTLGAGGFRFYLDAATAGAVTTTPPDIVVPIFDSLSTATAIVNIGSASPNPFVLGTATVNGKLTLKGSGPAGDAIVLDATLVTTAARKLYVKELDVCSGGVAKKQLVLCSDPY